MATEGVSSRKIREMRAKIMDEISYALGFGRQGLRRLLIRPIVWLPASRFAWIAARFDHHVPTEGLPGGSRQLLSDLMVRVVARGEENIPIDGPLLVVSNHPGAYDSVSIASRIPRPDLKIVVTDVPFLRAVPNTDKQFIYVPAEIDGRMAALRKAIQYLQEGGSVLIFAHGEVEPDPGFMQGAWEAIGEWSSSVEVMLRKVPDTWLQVVIASDVLFENFVKNPITHLQKTTSKRQKLAEFLQVGQQLVFPSSLHNEVHISFANPVRGADLGSRNLMPKVIEIAREQLKEHMSIFHNSSVPGYRIPTETTPIPG